MNFSLNNIVSNTFKNAINKAYDSIVSPPLIITVSNPSFGDYQCNSAPMIFKSHKYALKEETTVEDIAKKIQENIDSTYFSTIVTSKQGFITVRFSSLYLQEQLVHPLKHGIIFSTENKRRCLVDYSSPNIAKQMHVGHLRSTILGESICRVLEFCGHTVLRINHLGDWGTQFGMLIEHLKETVENFDNTSLSLSSLTSFYKEAKLKFDTDLNFKRRSQLNVPLLQNGDPNAIKAWKLLCDISRIGNKEIYDRLGITLVERGESFYNSMIPSVVEEIKQKGYITNVEGALCMFLPQDKVPLFVVKSDGGYGYDTTDLAAIKHRLVEEKHDIVIYVTDSGQESHIKKIIKAAELLNWYSPTKQKCYHVGFGLVQGDDGKKFKTRSGSSVRLADLMDEAVYRCAKELKQRYSSDKEKASEENILSDEEIEKAAESMGYSAIKYFDLKQNRNSNYKFSYDKMLDPKGNTAVYLLYTYARICSIFRKKKIIVKNIDTSYLKVTEQSERELVLQMLKFNDIIQSVSEDFYIHRITDFVYNLCVNFTNFYQSCKILSSENESSRLLLCEATRQYLQTAFHLLGIQPLEKI